MLVLRLDVHRDDRGWFKENWQRARMVEAGLPDFGPVQNNMSLNAQRGVTRGIHAEPWDKLVSVAIGKVFAAWVDLRPGEHFGATYWTEIDENVAVFVPRGVGNAYQALVDGTVYSYLVNDHYSPGTTYPALDLADETVAIPWPIPLAEAETSEKDLTNPSLAEVTPMPPKRTLITGCRGQLGQALAREFPDATLVDLDELDLTDPKALEAWPWQEYGVVLNAAAYTAVDRAETPEGRADAWAANAAAPAALARIAARRGLTLVHYSTDYVFDGSEVPGGHAEDEPFAPLGVYGQTKAAGDIAVATAPRHYVLRTSWVIGEGHNFVRTMQKLAADGVDPAVVDDQVGRLTFTDELARATRHLLDTGAAHGTYNVTNSGVPRSWADYARCVFELTGHDPARVSTVTSEEYAAGKSLSPRPLHSTLCLDKLAATGFVSRDAEVALADYTTPLG
ncbi:dTDP-4-dehydrorhamnose reductase [Nocardioides sp. Root190]|nr:dTDP-4-dehydrorhamnose reductase [Nocardioides sp. Root190]